LISSTPRLNVVFLLTDDQGYGDLGCHGNPILQTPCIDRFHDQSVRFTNFHVGPTCAPTRSGLFTGHYANSTGVWHTVGGRSLLRGNETTLAHVMLENGYRTALFGKWHLGDNAPYRPQDRGFEHVVCHGGGGISQVPDYWGNDYFDDHFDVNGEAQPFRGYCTDVFFNEAMRFIEEHRDEPFFCVVASNAPHSPYNVERRYSDPYRGQVGTEDRANFYGMIANLDENFGRLVNHLDTLGIAGRTLVVFMTDNGTSMGDGETHNCGMRGFKNSEYDGGHRVPFFLRAPESIVGKPRDIDTLTANIDFMPTMMDLCGIDPESYAHCGFHGRSLRPLLRGGQETWLDRALVTDSQRLPIPVKWRKSSVMTQRWRLINGTELYDIYADPGQVNNIADDHPDVVKDLRLAYERWWETVSGQFDEAIPIVIGDPREPEARLTAHDWRPPGDPRADDPHITESNDYLVFEQGQVREGKGQNGYFEVEVLRSGRYRFELRRWPREEGRPIVAGIEDSNDGFRDDVISSKHHRLYRGGKALPFVEAGVSLGEISKVAPVRPEAEFVEFHLDLQPGPARLSTWFRTRDGEERGAYFVYVSIDA
jgi:arylsulfatase A-like enzyme